MALLHTITDEKFQWLILFLYGITANLFAYCLSFLVSSPLAAFALVAGYQFVTFIVRPNFT